MTHIYKSIHRDVLFLKQVDHCQRVFSTSWCASDGAGCDVASANWCSQDVAESHTMGVLNYLVRYADMNIRLSRQSCRMSTTTKGLETLRMHHYVKPGSKSPEAHGHNHRERWRKAPWNLKWIFVQSTKPNHFNWIGFSMQLPDLNYFPCNNVNRTASSGDECQDTNERAEFYTCRVRRLTASQALAMSSFILSSEVVQASSVMGSGITFSGMDNGRDSKKNRAHQT